MWPSQLRGWILDLPRTRKRRIVMAADVAISGFSVILAIWLRLGDVSDQLTPGLVLAVISAAMALPIFILAGLYRQIFRESGIHSILEIGRATIVYGFIFAILVGSGVIMGIPRTVGVIQPILLFLLVSASRVLARAWADRAVACRSECRIPRVLIYGAGSAGRQIAAALESSRKMRVAAFLDDDASLHSSTINGVPVLDPAQVRAVARRYGASDVLLALPSVSQFRRNKIIEAMRSAMLHVRTLPGILDIASGKVEIGDIRELDINDLLGRSPVQPRVDLLKKNIRGKTVLVTGAGGSIGSELCRQALALRPRRLLLLDLCEYALYEIHQQLAEMSRIAFPGTEIVPLLGSVTDEARIRGIIQTWTPDTIYHAAAYKHVPIVEHNPIQGVRNNVSGTHLIARIAGEAGVGTFILISTDKAVRPTNVMGASKRAAELALQALNGRFPRTCFTIVRFGNVLGSSGSVVPLFRHQIANGGPLTVTDLRITRYFMSIAEAAQLVIQAGAMARGGEVFVLDMGDPVRIADLARRMAELSGLTVRDSDNPVGDIEIAEIGLRPGEKLYEELLIGNAPRPTLHPRILKANEHFLEYPRFERALSMLEREIEWSDPEGVIAALKAMVSEFTPAEEIVDWVALEDRLKPAMPMREVIAIAARGSGQPTPLVFPTDSQGLPAVMNFRVIGAAPARERDVPLRIVSHNDAVGGIS